MMLNDCRVYFGFLALVVLCMPGNSQTVSPERENIINAARCSLRCLSLLQPQQRLWQSFTRFRPAHSNALARCLAHENCTACLRPCSQTFIGVALCESICKPPKAACTDSCAFLQQAHTSRPGQCPSEHVPSQRHCERDCSVDTECTQDKKCCTSVCGYSCMPPTDKYKGVAEIPTDLTVTERPKGGAVDISWRSVHNNLTGTVLYIIESRWTVGQHYSDASATHWQQIAQTTSSHDVLRDITPGHWYKFRVSAVSLSGCRGHSEQTEPFRLNREPRAPSPPRNVTEGDTIIHNQQISVTIHWLPPKKSDLPISRYKLFWSPKQNRHMGKMGGMPGLGEMRKVLKGDILEYELPNLLYDTTYLIQVQAICKYGDKKLKSPRTNMYFTTYQQEQLNNDQPAPSPVVVTPPPATPAPLTGLAVRDMYFQNGLLKANVSWDQPVTDETTEAIVEKVLVYWKPDVCITDNTLNEQLTRTRSSTTHDNYFVLCDLYFDCRYTVTIRPMSKADKILGPELSITFPLPSCNEVTVRGQIEPDCPTSVPQVPVKPPHFEYSFRLSESDIAVHLSWHTPPSDTPITGYRIIWQPVGGDTSNSDVTPLTKVLSKVEHSCTIAGLRAAQTYSVQLQAMSNLGTGRTAQLNFTAPDIYKDAPYRYSSEDEVMSEVNVINAKSRQESQACHYTPSYLHWILVVSFSTIYLLAHT